MSFPEANPLGATLGHRVMANILGEEAGFGLKLQPHNVDSALAEDRRKVQALLKTPSALGDEVRDVIAMTLK